MDLVTVVIPVYNTENYLDACVSSVVNQTYKNLQILLIDDGSPDSSPQRCEEWAKRDSRITVIHKKNEGLGMARNTGIAYAEGNFLCFLDSDDYLAPETIELARKEKADVVIYGFQSVNEAGRPLAEHTPDLEKRIYRGREVQETFLPMLIAGEKGLQPSACWALFSMELVRGSNWRFPSEREIISEDVYALLELFQHVKTAAVLPKALYRYRKNTASLSRAYRPDRFEKAKQFYEKCRELCGSLHYPPQVLAACREPFLALAILSMKQETSDDRLRTILEDPLLQSVLDKTRAAGWKRRLLFHGIRHKQYSLCRILLAAQRWKESGIW